MAIPLTSISQRPTDPPIRGRRNRSHVRRRSSQGLRRRRWLALERLEDRSLLCASATAAGVIDLSQNFPDLNSQSSGVLQNAAQVDTYRFTVTPAMNTGRLSTQVNTNVGAPLPRLSICGADGSVLIDSDDGQIFQHLEPGTFVLSVSGQTGPGNYQLRTQFTPTHPPFQPPGTGKRPTLGVADVNGDGFQDLVTANYNDNSVSVLLGVGDGSFQALTPVQKFPVGVAPLGAPTADLNGDGHVDVVTSNYHDGTVSVLLGKGDGTFQQALSLQASDGPDYPVIAEINGDGKPDIITPNYIAGSVSVILGNGDGTFRPQLEFKVGSSPGFVSVADVNGDSRPDILSPNGDDTLSVLLNLGNGANGDVTFQPQSIIPTDSFPFALEAADFNGDGKADLVSAHRSDNTVRLQLGNGDGTFGSEASFAAGNTAYSLAVADLNGDGRPDVVVANRNAGTVSVLLSKGDGTFLPQEVLPVGQRPLTIRVADVNRDAHPDILVGNADDNTVSVLLGRGDGSFAFPAGTTAAAGKRPFLFAVGDLRGDGHADIVTANSSNNSVSVLLGAAGGSFQPHQIFPVGDQPIGMAMADFNGDGQLDLVVTNKAEDTVGVLLALGDGNFGPETKFTVGAKPLYVAAEDLDGDHRADIIVTNLNSGSVSVLLGHGDGSFDAHRELPTGVDDKVGAYGVAVADINGDGKPDIVVSNYNDNTVGVLLNNGGGAFQDRQILADVGALPAALALGDVNGDHVLDIVLALSGEKKVAVLLGRDNGQGQGDGTFGLPQSFDTGGAPTGVALADFNQDTRLDVVVSNRADNSVSLLRGNGTATLLDAQQTLPVGRQPFSISAADVTGDGKPDITTANASDSTVSVLAGNGDGTFRAQTPFALGKRPFAVVVADVSGDGNPDSITANYNTGNVSVARGNGNGSFQDPQSFEVGSRPLAVTLADLNRDGRSDLVTANSGGNSVSVLLSNGDGTFQAQRVVAVGQRPSAVTLVDVNGDGHLDLVVGNYDEDNVSVLLGRGDGTFRAQQKFAVGNGPNALRAADLNADNKLDLVVTNIFDNSVSVLLNTSNGIGGNAAFQTPATFAVGAQPYDVAIADVDGDGKPDLVTANYGGNSVSVLRGSGTGGFSALQTVSVGQRPVAVSVADVNGDRRPDLVATNRRDGTLSIVQNNGPQNNGGLFALTQTLDAGQQPVSTAVTNVNGDGRPSIVSVNYSNSTPRVLLASTSSFKPTTPGNAIENVNNTALVDLTRDGVRDRVILDAAGNVLFRQGLAGNDSAFLPPEILNTGRRARDMAVVNTGSGVSVATADSSFDPTLSAAANQFIYTVSLYSVSAGTVTRQTAFTSLLLPTRITAADLTGDGRDDIVVTNSLDNSVQVALQQANGSFSAPLTLNTGEAPSSLVFTDVNSDGLRDIVATDQASGDISVFLNNSSHSFNTSLRYRAGNGLFGLDTKGAAPVVVSALQSVSLAAGDFTGDGRNDIVVVNRGEHSFSVLANHGRGGLANPSLNLTTSTSDGFNINKQAGAVVAGDFNRDSRLDLAVLMEDTGMLWIFTGRGDGKFDHTFSIPAGDQATGLSVVPGATGNGLLDLLVGNGFGDVLHLKGKGNGTFQISGQRVSLSVVPDLLGPGLPGVLVGNQKDNRVTVQTRQDGGSQFTAVGSLAAAGPITQFAPGDVLWAMLDRNDALPDAVVVSSGSNAVIVYRTTAINNGVPSFDPNPQTLFVGSSPTGVTVADINNDNIPDMVIANPGSNDVSLLFGSFNAQGNWVGVDGPRLRAGGAGPIAAAVRDLTGDGVLDLTVSNGQSGTLTLLSGVGGGFFDDQSPRTLFNLGAALVQPPTFVGDTGLGYAVTGGGDLVRFDLKHVETGAVNVFPGQGVLAARALENGSVVVAVTGGIVKLLEPQGNGLQVVAEFGSQGATPTLPSTLEVLRTSAGQFQVLVSSQGSDTIFVYSRQTTSQPTAFLTSTFGVLGSAVGAATNALASVFSSSASGAFNSSVAIVSLAFVAGLSGSGFSSYDSQSEDTELKAKLVEGEGNKYSTVPLLDFGAQADEGSNTRVRRKPWPSTNSPLGDASPLSRFVSGQEEALKQYRESAQADEPEDGEMPPFDPWYDDLFHRAQPARPLSRDDEQDGFPEDELFNDESFDLDPDPAPEEPDNESRLRDRCFDDPLLLTPTAAAHPGAKHEALATLMAGLILAPIHGRNSDVETRRKRNPKLSSKHWD